MRRARPVIENMAQVRVGGFGADFGALHSVRPVRASDDLIWLHRFAEAGPAAIRIKLVQGTEQGFARNDVDVNPRPFLFPKLVAEGWFGGGLLRNRVLQRRELRFQLGGGRLLKVCHSSVRSALTG